MFVYSIHIMFVYSIPVYETILIFLVYVGPLGRAAYCFLMRLHQEAAFGAVGPDLVPALVAVT